MPQPPQPATDRLIAIYQQAQDDIAAQLAALADSPRKTRLTGIARNVTARLDELEAASREWLTVDLAGVYQHGAQVGAVQLDGQFVWTQAHVAAVQALVSETWADILAATAFVRAAVKRWLADQIASQTGLSLLEGRTAQQAARALVSAAGEAVDALGGPVMFVRYADGSYRRLADYADTALRTTTARAFNAGTLNTVRAAGVGFVEALDGTACGWTSHEDGDKANGTVRTVTDAASHPLSHPRCRRSFIARPDIASTRAAASAAPSVPAARQADQTATEVARQDTFQRRRAARTTRTARAARAARV